MAYRFVGTLIDCPHCGASYEHQREISTRDRHGGVLRSVICENCGHVFTNPMPTAQEVDAFYATEYRALYKRAVEPKPRHILRSARVAVERYRQFAHLLAEGARVLDLGCASGELVYVLGREGHEAIGIEPNVGYAEYGRDAYGIDVRIGTYADAGDELGAFDAVISFHVFEHLIDPQEAFAFVAGVLKPGGLLVIEVPNVRASEQTFLSRFHFGHVQHYSSDILKSFAARNGLAFVQDLIPEGGNVGLVFRRGEGSQACVAADETAANPMQASRQATEAALAPRPMIRRNWISHNWRKLRRQIEERWRVAGKSAPEVAKAEIARLITL